MRLKRFSLLKDHSKNSSKDPSSKDPSSKDPSKKSSKKEAAPNKKSPKSLSFSAVNFRRIEESKEDVPIVVPVVPVPVPVLPVPVVKEEKATAVANSSSSPLKKSTTQRPRNSSDNNDNGCVLFEDKSEDGKEMYLRGPPPTPKLTRMGDLAGPLGLFCPPREVTIDPDAIPPSPMRDPFRNRNSFQTDYANTDYMTPQKQQQQPQRSSSDSPDQLLTQYRQSSSNSPTAELALGAPLGDIGMRTQLWDAQRLVRVIMGKHNDKPLEAGAILQSIRVFAVMKQELLLLRKQQEHQSGDPPAIMEALGSPSTTATTAFGYSSSVARSLTPQKTPSSKAFTTTPASVASPEAFLNKRAIVEAAKKIQSLDRQLQQATDTIHTLLQLQKQQKPIQDAKIQELQDANLTSQRRLAQAAVEKEALETELEAFHIITTTTDERTATLEQELETVKHTSAQHIADLQAQHIADLQARHIAEQQYHAQLAEQQQPPLDAKIQELQAANVASQRRLAQAQMEKEALETRFEAFQTISIRKHEHMATLEQQLETVTNTSTQHIADLQAQLAEQQQQYQYQYQAEWQSPPPPMKVPSPSTESIDHSTLVLDALEREYELATMEELAPTPPTNTDDDPPAEHSHAATTTTTTSRRILATGEVVVSKTDDDLPEHSHAAATTTTTTTSPREQAQLVTIDVLHQRIASLEAQNADHHASVSLLERTLEALQQGGSEELSPKWVLQELQANMYKQTSSTKPQHSSSQQRLQVLHDEHQALVATIQVLEEEMTPGT